MMKHIVVLSIIALFGIAFVLFFMLTDRTDWMVVMGVLYSLAVAYYVLKDSEDDGGEDETIS